MKDASLFILDEPSASLDAKVEYEVFQQFTQLKTGRMAVLISQRMALPAIDPWATYPSGHSA